MAFFHTLTELVDEKERRVRLGMHMMGLSAGAFWAAEAVKSLAVVGWCKLKPVLKSPGFGA